jgi:hypothetical protein
MRSTNREISAFFEYYKYFIFSINKKLVTDKYLYKK